jgi:hypothetical protein
VKPLDPPDSHHLLAAEGWIQLGDYAEAQRELEKIAPECSTHADVLKVRWRICGKTQDLETALTVAQTICRLEPSHPFSRVHQAEALQSVESPSPATGQPVLRLPYLFAIPYNLACYACQLGNLEEAWDWLEVAIEISDPGEVKKIAMNDPDLEPLWIKLSDI